MQTVGLPRSYFYRRIAEAMHEVIARGATGEEQQQEMVTKVDLQEALNRLRVCPVCGNQLVMYSDYPMERSCSCGDFNITAVWSDGDVSFEFKMTALEKAQEDVASLDVEQPHDGG